MEDNEVDEDTPSKIAERIACVDAMLQKERMRVLCHAAAMSRLWGVPASYFCDIARGPNIWNLGDRGYSYKRAVDNGGVKSLLEMCLDTIDSAYAIIGDRLGPNKRFMDANIRIPTAYDHNNALCIVKRQRVE